MFLRIENWLRRIIAEEVAKVKVSFENERKNIAFQASFTLKELEAEVSKLLSDKKVEIDNLKAMKDVPSHWQATPDIVAADHGLRKAK